MAVLPQKVICNAPKEINDIYEHIHKVSIQLENQFNAQIAELKKEIAELKK